MPLTVTEDSIRRIYRETLDDFYGVVSRRCDGDRDLAEDVVQETWLKAVRAWQANGIPEKPMAWLTTVASRIISNQFRRRAPKRFDEATSEVAEVDMTERREKRSLIQRALDRLPAMQANLLEAFHLEDRAVTDIAREHRLTERAVEGRLRRARQNLRRVIDKEDS